MIAQLTIITSDKPATLSKTVQRGADGTVVRSGGGILIDGQAQVQRVGCLRDLQRVLEGLGPSQALTFGIPRGGNGRILSRKALSRQRSPAVHSVSARRATDIAQSWTTRTSRSPICSSG